MENKDLATKGDQGVAPRPDVLSLAVEKGAGVEELKAIMELQERYEANEARKAYHVSMAAFKADPPKIDKDASVSYGNTSYKHATLANVTDKINAALSDHGLSATWQTDQVDKKIKVTCKITHILGHSETTSLESEADDSGKKNSIQAIGSAVTYLQRYTILSLTGLATSEMDDDGAGAESVYITGEQVEEINNLIESKGIDNSAFLTYMEAEHTGAILAKDYKKAKFACNKAQGAK